MGNSNKFNPKKILRKNLIDINMLRDYNETGARCGICLISYVKLFYFLKIYGRMYRYNVGVSEKILFTYCN